MDELPPAAAPDAADAQLRHAGRAALRTSLTDARRRLLACVEDLSDAQWRVPQQAGVNPVAWEIAHVGWFTEFWTRRGPHRVNERGLVDAARAPLNLGPDEVLDSARLPHAARWQAPLPARAQVLDALAAQLDATLATLARTDERDDALYPYRLSLAHEDMHAEALTWMRATLAYPPPRGAQLPPVAARGAVRVSAGRTYIGTPAGAAGFAFDNERDGLAVELAGFEIDRAPVTAGEYLRFVRAGGYDDPALWPADAGAWRRGTNRAHPERWRAVDGRWQVRWFDRWQPLDEAQPLIHVNAYEAQAYCAWAGRRLPRAAEWEAAAAAGAIAVGSGVWEWTGDAFAPYPGFAPGPYKDYSAPWFHTHRELRGGAFCTAPRLRHARYRNFFTPERCDVFVGFRTAADAAD